jgi:hypothetical protein
VTAVAFAIMVLEFAGQDELIETVITAEGVTEEHTPEYEGNVDEQLCDVTIVVLIDSNTDTVKT